MRNDQLTLVRKTLQEVKKRKYNFSNIHRSTNNKRSKIKKEKFNHDRLQSGVREAP